MKTLLLFCLMVMELSGAQTTLTLSGTLTNTTAGIAAPAKLEVTQIGDRLSARLVTFPPLSGTGTLTGICLDGWCELSGQLEGGWMMTLHGVLNERDFRGTYVVKPAQGLAQYGRLELARVASTLPPASRPGE